MGVPIICLSAAAAASCSQSVTIGHAYRLSATSSSVKMSQLRLEEVLKTKAREAARILARTEEQLEQMVARCGAAWHLVPDTLLVAMNVTDHYPPAHQAYIIIQETATSIECLAKGPLLTALQEARVATAAIECRHCQPKDPLTVKYYNYSGSSAESLFDLVTGKVGTSDFDVMYEFGGPFRWAVVAEEGTEPEPISPEAAPQLWVRPANTPGFVTLYWARTSRCSHEAPLAALPADSLRRLMRYYCRVWSLPNFEITCSGPAVNIRNPDAQNGGQDHVPCLRLPWWPEEEDFLCRHRVTDFPPAAVRRDICRFGVHLVPTGHPGSSTEQSEYRVSFSRAEVVTVRRLSPVQHETIRATKGMKKALKGRGAAPAIKSYYIKTAVLWLVQDQPSDCWTGVTRGVNMVLDWLEHHLSVGSLPCFFWSAINLVAGCSTADLKDMINTVQVMRSQATQLLMAFCDKLGFILEAILEGGSEPLSELQLRLRLTRYLVLTAVMEGIGYRSTAPCWESFTGFCMSILPHMPKQQLLQGFYRYKSGAYRQQCYLLLAFSVAPADLVSEMRLTTLDGGDTFTWPVKPLLALLSESELRRLLGDPAAVAAWCHRQLLCPPEERTTDLTAELDTPQGRAELLLQPELLLRAFWEAVPLWTVSWQMNDKTLMERWEHNYEPYITYRSCQLLLRTHIDPGYLEFHLRFRLPKLDGPTVAATAHFWRQRLEHLLSGARLRNAYTTVTTRWPDRWQLLQYVVTGSTTEQGKTRRQGRNFISLWEGPTPSCWAQPPMMG